MIHRGCPRGFSMQLLFVAPKAEQINRSKKLPVEKCHTSIFLWDFVVVVVVAMLMRS